MSFDTPLTLHGPLRTPRQMLADQEYDGHASLHDDSMDEESLGGIAKVATIPLVVDLFKVPKRIQYAREFFGLVKDGNTIAGAARRLGLSETTANKAYRTGRVLAERGLDDAYIQVTEMPDRPGRWRPHSDRADVFDKH